MSNTRIKKITDAQFIHLKKLVLRTYQMLDEGMTYQEIANYLNERNVKSALGKKFNYHLIQKMVSHIHLDRSSNYSRAYKELIAEGQLMLPKPPTVIW